MAAPGEALWQLLSARVAAPRPRRGVHATLAPVRELLARLDNPQQGLRALHIAGSKGKGSTAIYCEALLRGAGLRTGLFLSPHLQDWRERFQIDGRYAAETELAATAEALSLALARCRLRPGFFDLATAAALWLFRRCRVDCAVIEAGIGARRDATRVIRPAACCITAVELEHRDRLGPGLRSIAAEKAGVIRDGVPVVLGPVPAAARRVLLAQARRRRAPLLPVNAPRRSRLGAATPPFTDGNARLALATVAASGLVEERRGRQLARRLFPALALPGRCEVLAGRPPVLLDCAHTLDSAHRLRSRIRDLGWQRALTWLLACKDDKPLPALLAVLLGGGDRVVTTCVDERQGLPAAALAAAVAAAHPDLPCQAVADPHQALGVALAGASDDRPLCVAGSVYLAGLVRSALAERVPPARTAAAALSLTAADL